MRSMILLAGLWASVMCLAEARKNGKATFHRSTVPPIPSRGSAVATKADWEDVPFEDTGGRSDDELFEVDEDYYDIRRVDDDELEVKDEDFQMGMPSLKSAVFGMSAGTDHTLSSSVRKDALYDAYNQLHTLAQVSLLWLPVLLYVCMYSQRL
jgi:hypothetical protein